MQKTKTQSDNSLPVSFPPVVAVVGHVDHGKTTLLDALRKTSIASREHGGITQKIGASRIEFIHEGNKRAITFIDTPGHEAFVRMRGRGVQAADIVLLVISATDGVMPQTKESIKLLQTHDLPFIVVITKADLPEKNIEKIKQQLAKEQILVEGYGGNVPLIEVSARSGMNITELLELIVLVHQMHPAQNSIAADAPLSAIVIESSIDQQKGPKATIVVKNGTIAVKDEIHTGDITARVRALINDMGKQLKQVSVGEAVELLGFSTVPPVGSIIEQKTTSASKQAVSSVASPAYSISEDNLLKLILCADTYGSLEAITAALPKEIAILQAKTGDISEADVLQAKSTKSIIITFNIKLKQSVVTFARNEKILLKNYTIIYELLQELQEVIEGKQLALMEQLFGQAQILATFPFNDSQVLGIKVIEGRIAKGDRIRLIRNDDVIGESMVVSLRQGKNSASKIEKGQEAGIIISPFLDFRIGDVILSHS